MCLTKLMSTEKQCSEIQVKLVTEMSVKGGESREWGLVKVISMLWAYRSATSY